MSDHSFSQNANSSRPAGTKKIEEFDSVVIRFAGDSGDGMQMTGDQFTTASAMMGEDVSTLPDYPAEIRAPAGTVAGVSGFQLCFGTQNVYTPGDEIDVLIAMNPAAFKTNLPMLKTNGIVIANEDAFTEKNLEKAGYSTHPLVGTDLDRYRIFRINIARLTKNALADLAMTPKQIDRCKNFFALGLTYGLFNRSMEPTIKWLKKKFASKPEVLEANLRTLNAGWNYGETAELFTTSYVIRKREHKVPGVYRYITGNSASALGLVAAAQKAKLKLFLGSYPITPASEILHELSHHPDFATVFQAEDEIAGIGSALGAAFGGALAATSTSGPGLSLKSEFMNLAVMVELPLVIINVQRAGPSTGLPTKSEQSDLFQALWGRHGESPIVVIAPCSPRDCFYASYEAAQIALKYMTPVVVLSDGYLGNGAEVWRIPSLKELGEIKTNLRTNPEGFFPYLRDPQTLARPWAVPGVAGLEHRIGGLEKEDITGATSHSPENHEKMVKIRAEKIERVTKEILPMSVYGDPKAEVLVMGWGSTYGVIRQAVEKLYKEGWPVACTHLRYLNPLPSDLKKTLERFPKVLIPENNMGQLWYRLRAEYLIDAERLNKVQGLPFRMDEIVAKIKTMVGALK